jgi:hypothetical protein
MKAKQIFLIITLVIAPMLYSSQALADVVGHDGF